MFDETCINEALSSLILKGNYNVIKMDYDEKHFGNFVIELSNNELFDIRFTSDRGQLWCEINQGSTWILINDIFTVMGVKFSYNINNEYCKSIEVISNEIYKNIDMLKMALDKSNSKATLHRIEELKQKRADELLKKYKFK